MFTGIIETLGKVQEIKSSGTNLEFRIQSKVSHELKIDQSISHNGVCLTVTELNDNWHEVTAVKQTLDLSNLKHLKPGSLVNLERCTQLNGRLDGHIVQGHVDGMAKCSGVKSEDGSWKISFEIENFKEELIVDKGSITINGVSLTLAEVKGNKVSVAIIPYTYENTMFHQLKIGDSVNIEYDIIGKYVAKWMNKS